MMDYVQRPLQQTYTGSVSSSVDTISGSGSGSVSAGDRRTCSHPRVRTIRLTRPPISSTPSLLLTCGRQGPGFGFSLRGGREFGTGFFVSSVELGSEAHLQGLKVGDQILRINGFTVDDAIHKEVLQLVSNHTHLTLKVRNVGMIPVKEKCSDPLGWQIIQDTISISSGSPPLGDKLREIRINISVAPRSKLGCGICKGPEWKPGIFVQFTKDGGIAREAGLRPGDQILFCNGVDFNNLAFNEAVNVLKNSHQLDLLVRKGAGLELFPGESSGYNSSASSVTGDQSPSWSDSKRLSIVKEETLELEDRLSQLDSRYKPNRWTGDNWDSQSNDSGGDQSRNTCKPTIINLSENGTTIKNNGAAEEMCQSNELNNQNNITSKLLQHEVKTVVVEVHRSEIDDDEIKNNKSTIDKSPSASSLTSFASSTASSSLSNAISQELLRRSERNKEMEKKPSAESETQKKKLIKNVDSDMKHQHDKLMDEFKKAHRKMFASTLSHDEIKEATETNNDTPEKDRENQLSSINIPQLRHVSAISTNTAPPPPPPPMPSMNTNENELNKSTEMTGKPLPKKPKAPPVPQKTYKKDQCYPPPCPTPDYDNLSLNSVIISNNNTLNCNMQVNSNALHQSNTTNNTLAKKSAKNVNNCINDAVEMESLESFKLNNPSGPKPKPPNTYFDKPRQKLSSQHSIGSVTSLESVTSATTMKKIPRPVSVTIGEYQSDFQQRREPSKFEFLSQSKSCDFDEQDGVRKQPITSRFASELSQTLSRSNLKTKTDMDYTITSKTKQQNGSVTINVNNAVNNVTQNTNNSINGIVPHKPLLKTQSINDLSSKHIENMANSLSNRLTIRISDNAESKKLDSSPPNGILKNGNGNNNNCFNNNQHRPVMHQKSITFGEITTVINDRSLHVT